MSEEDRIYRIDTGKGEVSATVVYRDPTSDIAILDIDGRRHPYLKLGSTDQLEVGDSVVSVGNPEGKKDVVSRGKVSLLSVRVVAKGEDGEIQHLPDAIRTTVRLTPGDSGGPLIDARTGTVVGISTARGSGREARIYSYSLPIERALQALAKAKIRL